MQFLSPLLCYKYIAALEYWASHSKAQNESLLFNIETTNRKTGLDEIHWHSILTEVVRSLKFRMHALKKTVMTIVLLLSYSENKNQRFEMQEHAESYFDKLPVFVFNSATQDYNFKANKHNSFKFGDL